MLLKAMEIQNFGRYAGENVFDAGVTADRNVILINAKNDRGKTTLLQAIKFAMYGEDGIWPKSTHEWINMQKASEGDGAMYVKLRFEHEGEEYALRRQIEFRKTRRGQTITTIGKPTVDIFQGGNLHMVADSNDSKQD